MAEEYDVLKIDPVIKDIWLKALRSGEYVQAKGALRTQSGFCCLGVLCDALKKAEHPAVAGMEWLEPNHDGMSAFGGGDIGLPSPEIRAALYGADGSYNGPTFNVSEGYLPTLNDKGMFSHYNEEDGCPVYSEPHTFEQIADLIEKDL